MSLSTPLLRWLTLLAPVCCCLFAARGILHFFQLESYQFPGYFRTLKRNRVHSLLPGVCAALATLVLLYLFDLLARRLLARTGLAVGAVEVPGEVLPWQVFSGVSVARAVKQLSHSLERSFGHDMSRHALWLGASGLTWSAGDEPGDVYSVATAENLIAHTPPQTPDGVGVVVSVPLPGLTHSRLVHIRDTRRGVDETVRALTVAHTFQGSGNSTVISYGKDTGWL